MTISGPGENRHVFDFDGDVWGQVIFLLAVAIAGVWFSYESLDPDWIPGGGRYGGLIGLFPNWIRVPVFLAVSVFCTSCAILLARRKIQGGPFLIMDEVGITLVRGKGNRSFPWDTIERATEGQQGWVLHTRNAKGEPVTQLLPDKVMKARRVEVQAAIFSLRPGLVPRPPQRDKPRKRQEPIVVSSRGWTG